jgi:hypothetical protein
MIDKFTLYRFTAPFRSRLQNRLRRERLNIDADVFARGFEDSRIDPGLQADGIWLLWELLREAAFISDFRPDPDDSLSAVYAMGPEEVRDDVIEPLLAKLGLSTSGIDFTGFDFSSIVTPKDVLAFVMKVADAQNGKGKRRFVDMAK